MILHLDYETRSRADLLEVGEHRYGIDHSTEVLMAGVSREGDPKVYLWVNPEVAADLGENAEVERLLADCLRSDAPEIHAHNASFEQAVTWGTLANGKTSPFKTEPPLTVWRCSAAVARKAGLPSSLEKLCDALRVTDSKDRAGKALIKLFSIPDDMGVFASPKAHPEKWGEFCEYCRQDVRAETECGRLLKPFALAGAPLATFQFDLRMNQRGIPINLTAAQNAQQIIDAMQVGAVEEFRGLTGLNPTQGKKFKVWLQNVADLYLLSLQAATLDTVLAAALTPLQRQVLTIFQSVSYAAVKKVQVMLDCICPDGRVRGTFKYYGAGTGRWSAEKLQPHNFKKTDPAFRPLTAMIYTSICNGISRDMMDEVFGSPLECVANVIRQFIHHPKYEMLDGDFAAVEARIICWLAGQDDVLEKWRKGEDLYKWMASHVYGVPVESITPDQREVGKRLILGAGFQMGWKKFQSSCLLQYQLALSDDLCKKGIKLFRSLCQKIRDYWWFLNSAAIETVKYRQPRGPFSLRAIGGVPFLLFRLRSGRSLAYPKPEVNLVAWVPDRDDDDERDESERIAADTKFRDELTYWGQLPLSQAWGRVKLYGGKLAENDTQATAADFMAHGAIVAESRGMEPFMLVHDQALALRDRGQTKEQFAAALGDLPAWATGFPMKVDVKIQPYFTK